MRPLRELALDLTPLRTSADYRRLWIGDAVSVIGTQMTAVAVPVQVYDITGSSFAVGLVGLVSFLGLVSFGLLGGAIADARDRRKVALTTSSGLALVSIALFLQALAGGSRVWPLYLLVAAQAALFAVDSPARRAITPRLIPPEQMPAASALGFIYFNVGVVLGPLLAGAIISWAGLRAAYAIDAVSFLAALYALSRLAPMPPLGDTMGAGWGAVVEGLRYLRSQHVLLMTFVVDLNAMIFGMPRALFPALAAGTFHGGSRTVGLLYAAPAIGALLAAAVGGWFGRVRRQGLAVLVSVAVWGLAIVGFGLTRTLWLAVVFLAVAGGADMVSAVFRNTILNVSSPDHMRGRLSGVFIVVVAGGPRLGDLEAGAVAAMVSPAFSIVSGGVACVVGVLALGLAVPKFARYREEPGD